MKTPVTDIYQFRLLLKGISPIIWRRVLVKYNSSIANFHHVIQMVMGWSNYYLHQFIIRGKSYGIAYEGGITFSTDPKSTLLKDFQFYTNENFIYEYNFIANWEVEIRLEKQLTSISNKLYPICIGGERTVPPENLNGSKEFMRLKDYYTDWRIEEILMKNFKNLKSNEIDLSDFKHIVKNLNYWININKFERRGVNDILKKFATNDPEWEDYMAEVIEL